MVAVLLVEEEKEISKKTLRIRKKNEKSGKVERERREKKRKE